MLEFLRHNFRWIGGGFLLTFCSSFGQTYFIAASVAEWQAQFSLSHGEFGRLYMGATIASAVSLPFVGKLVDILPEHKVLWLVMPALAAATFLAAFAWAVPVLFVAIYLLRLFGQGMMTHTALTATGRWFVAARGRAVSLVVLGHQGGEATIPFVFAVLAINYGYQTGWVVAGVTLMLIGLPLAVWAYSEPRSPAASSADGPQHDQGARQWTRAEALRDPLFWVLLTGVLTPAFIGTTIFYHQDYMTVLQGWPIGLFARSLFLMAATTVVCALLTGALVDRFGAFAVLPAFLLPLAASCYALSLDGPVALLFLVMFLLGISYGFSSTLFGALWPETYGTKHLGSIRAVTVSAAVFSTAAGPGITGTLIDRGIDLPEQMRFLALYCLAVMLLMMVASRALRRRYAAERATPIPE